MKYALLTYSTSNLGDDIQSLAAAQFLPRVDTLIDRDHLDKYPVQGQTSLICNGWWTHRPATWPPPPELRPVLISMHLREVDAVLTAFTSPRLREFYERHGPVGCRDTDTLSRFQDAGIPSYFSGCLTLTFPQYLGPRHGHVIFADPFGHGDFTQTQSKIGDRWWRSLPDQISKYAIIVTHHVDAACPKYERLALARSRLKLYREARLVITSRLHVALPCLAMGTPVVVIEPQSEPTRLSGLRHLLVMHSSADAAAGNWNIDWSVSGVVPIHPSANRIRRELTERCLQCLQPMSIEVKP